MFINHAFKYPAYLTLNWLFSLLFVSVLSDSTSLSILINQTTMSGQKKETEQQCLAFLWQKLNNCLHVLLPCLIVQFEMLASTIQMLGYHNSILNIDRMWPFIEQRKYSSHIQWRRQCQCQKFSEIAWNVTSSNSSLSFTFSRLGKHSNVDVSIKGDGCC